MKRTLGIEPGTSSPVSHRWQDLVHSNDPAAARAFGGEPPRRVPAIETALAMARESGEQPRAQPSTAAELAGAREVSMATCVLIERAYLDRVNVLGLLRRHDR